MKCETTNLTLGGGRKAEEWEAFWLFFFNMGARQRDVMRGEKDKDDKAPLRIW